MQNRFLLASSALSLACFEPRLAVPPLTPDQALVFELTASPDELFAGAESWEEPPRIYWFRMTWGDRGFRPLSIPGCGEVVDLVASSTELDHHRQEDRLEPRRSRLAGASVRR